MSRPCPDREDLLQALLDGELDAAHAQEAEAHLKSCAGCAAYFSTLQALRAKLGEAKLGSRASPRLRSSIEAMIAAEGRASQARSEPRWWSRAWTGWAAAGAMAAVAAGLVVAPFASLAGADLESQFVASHVRSLLANHLIDVAASDQHVVKPWFNGRVDFSLPTPDLSAQGYPLAGGRLDYADKRVVAAVVYRRNAHVINLFVTPHAAEKTVHIEERRDSYSVKAWTAGGLDFWAVSDIDLPDLVAFHKAFEAAAPL